MTAEPTPRRASGTPRLTSAGFLREVLRLATPYWSSEQKLRVRGVTFLLLILTGGQVGITVWGNYWNRDFFDALEARSVSRVLVQVAVFAAIFAASIAVTAAHLMVKRWLQLGWREWLTLKLVGRWMEGGRHYRLLLAPAAHDNPDQRIAEDIRIATESAVALAHTLVYSVLTLGLFVEILWSVSGPATVSGTTIQVPGFMVPLAFLYAGVGSALGWWLGRPLVRSTNALQTAEADFRFGLASAREHSEAIALVRGEPGERARASTRFAEIIRSWDRQSLAYMGLVSFSTGYGGLLPVFPLLVAAPRYIAGFMTLGALMQAAQAFQRLTGALSWPVDNLGELASCRTAAGRVLALHQDLERLDSEARAPSAARIVVSPSSERRLAIEDLSIAEPSGEVLLEGLSAELGRGKRLLVTGDSTVTSTLFKVIAGLWPWGRGRVLLPRDKDRGVLLIPQRPFLPEGSLRQALCYPSPPSVFDDKALRHALECAGILWLARRLDKVGQWERILPLREQQRLAFARALLKRPAWIVTQDATNAFHPRGEQLMFEMLHRELPDLAFLTIRSSPGLERFHHDRLVLRRPPAHRSA
ncbi:MAG TPA: ABC transporter ATP-binding protein/permease [Myxococcota bacterium]|nr:ABC transporter ATP-binding protein/permease [Myxococcota bacterium]